MIRKILSVLIGIALGVVGIMLIQTLSSQMYPMPEGLDYKDSVAFGEYVKTLPVGAFLMVILSYIVGSFFGGMGATLVAQEKYNPAIVVGAFFTLGGIVNGISMPQPIWVSFISIIIFVHLACVGAKVIPIKKT